MQKSSALLAVSETKQKSEKRIKFKIKERIIFGVIRQNTNEEKLEKKTNNNTSNPILKKGRRKKKKESNFNTGRWLQEEHQRFIEALLKFGNDWKNVQRYVGSRSSTQARSHAQKFFVKIGKTQIENLSLDFEKNSLKSLNLMANNLNHEQMSNAIKYLNEMAFEKKNLGKRQMNTENFADFNLNENSMDMDNMIIEFGCNKTTFDNDKFNDPIVTLKNKSLTGNKRLKGILNKSKEFEKIIFNDDPYFINESEDHQNEENFNFKKNYNTGTNSSNRKNSTDFSYPFNFINDNSLFLSAAMNFFKKPMDEKDFQIIFDNPFKFENKEINEENYASDIILLDRMNSSSNTKSNYNESRKNSSDVEVYGYTLDNNKDIIDEFLDCS